MSSIVIEVVSILAGFIAIGINESLTHKRDIRHKKEELLLTHLKEMLEWLNKIQQSLFSVSRILIDSIGIYSDKEKKKHMQDSFKLKSNEIVEESIIFSNSYAEINSTLGIDLDLKELNQSVGQYIQELRNIQEEYSFPDKDNLDLDKVNAITSDIEDEIKKRVKIISNEISKLLLK